MSARGTAAALASALIVTVSLAPPPVRADEPDDEPAPEPGDPGEPDEPDEPDDGFLGVRRLPLAIDDCPRTPELDQAAREAAAAEHYYRGDVLYVQGDYEGATRELVASYCLNPVARLLKNIGQSYERMVEFEAAAAYYERYVLADDDLPPGPCDPPPAIDRKNISGRIEVLRRLPSTVTVATEPPGSTIELANDAGRQALGGDGETLQVVAGTYEMTVSHPGYETRTSTVAVGIGRPYSFSFRLEPRRTRLQIQAVPGDARIFVDGRLAGLGAYDADVTLGSHDVMVEAAGRVSRQMTVELVEGENKPVAVELASLPGSGRRHLIAGSIAFGGIVGFGTGFVGGNEGGGAGLLIGALGGGAAGYLLVPRDVALGTGSFLLTTGFAGAVNGLAVGGMVNDADEVFNNDDDRRGGGFGMVGGAIIGVGTGLVLAPRLDISPGDAALFNSGAGWGAAAGALFIPIFDGQSRVRYVTLITGLDLGVLTGALLASRYDVSRRRVVFIDLAGLAGMLAGLATESAISGALQDQGSGERSAHYALGGMAIGLGLGTFLTRNLDLPKLPRLTPSVTRTADGAGGRSLMIGLGGTM